jgi:hypothetical protein
MILNLSRILILKSEAAYRRILEGEIMQQERISLPCGCILADKNSELRVELCREHSKSYRNFYLRSRLGMTIG